MINVSGLSKSYGGNVILRDLELSLGEGVFCLTGPSGSGKTTLARILCGLEEADSGRISGIPGTVTYMFQEPRLLPWKTACENVFLASPGDRAANAAAAAEMLARLGLGKDDQRKKPAELSGGMQQRTALARAALYTRKSVGISGSGSFLAILDEPLKGLDSATRAAAAAWYTLKRALAPPRRYSSSNAPV